jgi:hypothetical protein
MAPLNILASHNGAAHPAAASIRAVPHPHDCCALPSCGCDSCACVRFHCGGPGTLSYGQFLRRRYSRRAHARARRRRGIAAGGDRGQRCRARGWKRLPLDKRRGWKNFRSKMTGDRACAEVLLTAERKARAARRGIWADPNFAPLRSHDAARITTVRGQFALVEGKVLSVRESGATIYLNFGAARGAGLSPFSSATGGHSPRLALTQDGWRVNRSGCVPGSKSGPDR